MAKVLVIVDPDIEDQSALRRCSEIAPGANLTIDAVMFVPRPIHPIINASEKQSLLLEHKNWLDQQVKTLVGSDYNIRTYVLPFSRLYEEIVRTALDIEADLVLKPVGRHEQLDQNTFTATDRNLIRLCPKPLLLTCNNTTMTKPVVAAVDVCSSDPGHDELNRMVISQAQAVARAINSRVLLINVYTAADAVWGTVASDTVPPLVRVKNRRAHEKALGMLAVEFSIDPALTRVVDGSPDIALNRCAGELGAGVLVIGTVARTGLAGIFIGNTAEAVLAYNNIDTLFVKHADFKSPIAT